MTGKNPKTLEKENDCLKGVGKGEIKQLERSKTKYKRVVLKLSGEAFLGKLVHGIDLSAVSSIAKEIISVRKLGTDIAVVIGGGNLWRGREILTKDKMPFIEKEAILDRVTADYMGMLATVINALALQDGLEKLGQPTRVQTAIEMEKIAEPFIRRRAVRHLEKGRIVIFAGGTGNPYFTTDTAAALRAIEINADVFLKATKVDGVYPMDPLKNPKVKKYDRLTYMQALKKRLEIIDSAALSLCMDNRLPIIVFNLFKKGNLLKVMRGEKVGTLIEER